METARWVEFFCGMSAGLIETCILYPKTKLIYRQQQHGITAKMAFQEVVFKRFLHFARG